MTSDLTGYQRILVFGGSFDPPHRAHVELPQQVAKAIGADLIAYVPAGRAPHKLDREQTDPLCRLEMLRLELTQAYAHTDEKTVQIVILTDEIDRGPDKPSYTVDTLEQLRKRVDPKAQLRLLIGADQLRIFNSWREPNRVIALAEPVVMLRPPETRQSILASVPLQDRDAWSKRLIDVDSIDISSTQIRSALRQGKRTEHLLSPAVAKYIASHNLYQSR